MAKNKTALDSTQPKLSLLVPIAAIGASAGGQEAVVELLANLSPTTGLAFIYIQHLDPHHNSRLVDILARATAMPVLEAQHLMPIHPNHLYIIPPDRDLEVLDGVLTLVPREPRPAIHMPIDQFFLSLAKRQKYGAIAVVLSGTASDGTLGLRAIKAAGGITFAQDETARFQSMPRSAILEGVVDRVLPPAEIARELERLSRQVAVLQQTAQTEAQEAEAFELAAAEPTAGVDDDLRTILQLLRRATGVDFSHYKVTTIRRRILRRTLLFKLESLQEYATYLHEHPQEAILLYDDLLINVTSFFRDAETMDYIQKVLLPQLVRAKVPQEPIRIWVAACSTGQEAYSLAMLLLEVLGEQSLSRTIQIFATDLSESAVTKARLGSYTRGEVMNITPRRLQRFFTKTDDHYRINKSVRDVCVFAPHNLLKDPPFSRLDLISCRNLLIYLDTTLQRKAITTFHYALNPNGYLVLGKSETVGPSARLFSQPEKNYKVFLRKNDVDSRASFTMTPRFPEGEPRTNGLSGVPTPTGPVNGNAADQSEPPGQALRTGLVPDLDDVIDRLLLNQYVPASVVVNQDLEILQFRGATGLFLEPAPGKASLNLLKMARPSLVFELRNVVHKAQKSGEPVRKSGLEVKIQGKTHAVAIEAVPLPTAGEEHLFLIIFNEVGSAAAPATPSVSARNRRIQEVETELANLRDDMRSIIEEQEASNEELQSASEEIISSNEELQSINEELETSKEEIGSTNEELLTINQELQVRNDQLSEAYQFAEAIFGTIREATLVLDTDLRVRSANPAFYRLFGLNQESTEQRLIYELGNRQWDIPELRSMLTDIVTSDTVFEGFELRYLSQEAGEKTMWLNARRVVRNQVSILLAIEDITEHRRAQRLLAEREAWFHQIADNAPTIIWVTDASGHFTFLNKTWLRYTGRTLDDVRQHGLATGLHPDDQTPYREQYDDHWKECKPFSAEYRLRRHDGNYRWMQENAEPMFGTDGAFSGYIGSSDDVHLQKEMNQELDRLVRERTADLEQSGAMVQRMLDGSIAFLSVLEAVRDPQSGAITDFAWTGANQAAQTVIHRAPDELIGHRLFELFPDAKDFFADYVHVVETGESVRLERYYQGDNYDNWFDVSVVKHGDGLILNILDITDRKKADERIRQIAHNLQAVLNSSPAAIGFLQPIRDEAGDGSILDFRLVVFNQEFAQLAERTPEQLMNQVASNLGDKLWAENTVAIIRRVLETGEPFFDEQHGPNPDQCMAITLVKFDDGVVLTGQDITALKKAEKQQEHWLNELEKSDENIQVLTQLRQQLRERGEFLRSTSHDLRGNFGIIQGAATLLNMASSEEERTQMLDMLQRNLRQATQMLTELLDLSRLEAGQETRQIARFDAADLLCGLVESVQPLAQARGLWLRGEGDEPIAVQGDLVKVRRIAQNLVLNAIKYTKTGGVRVIWKANADHWQLTIVDTGPGLPADAGVHNGSGEGIGLLITRQLCDLLDCQMTVDSQPGVGTHFELTFPRQYVG